MVKARSEASSGRLLMMVLRSKRSLAPRSTSPGSPILPHILHCRPESFGHHSTLTPVDIVLIHLLCVIVTQKIIRQGRSRCDERSNEWKVVRYRTSEASPKEDRNEQSSLQSSRLSCQAPSVQPSFAPLSQLTK